MYAGPSFQPVLSCLIPCLYNYFFVEKQSTSLITLITLINAVSDIVINAILAIYVFIISYIYSS